MVLDRSEFLTLRATPSSTLTATETVDKVNLRDGKYNRAVFVVKATATLADPADELGIIVQTTYDNGTTWLDLTNTTLTNAHSTVAQTRVQHVGRASASGLVTPTSDGSMTDNTVVAIPIGMALRVMTIKAGPSAASYTYSVTAWVTQ